MGRPKAGIEGFRSLGGWGLAKTGAKHGQKIEPTHESGALLPDEEERWRRFSSISPLGLILDLRAKSGSLNAWSDLKSVRRSHCERDSFEYEMP